jgi:hypothetical protein
MSYSTGTHIEMRHGMLPGRTTSPAVPDNVGQQGELKEEPAQVDPNAITYVDPSADPAPDPLPPAA